MQQESNKQLNIDAQTSEQTEASKSDSKFVRFWDIAIWVLILVLALAVIVRVFVVTDITVSGDSMTSAYYNNKNSEFYNPSLTYHDKDVVRVSKTKKPKRGDVVVFYKKPVDSKFLAMFAKRDDVESGGKYYKLIKRVVALEGDKLWLEDLGNGEYMLVILTSDGETLHEDYYKMGDTVLDVNAFILTDKPVALGTLEGHTEDNPLVIKKGYFFALGDNRVNSDDSRGDLGQVPLKQLFGVVIK